MADRLRTYRDAYGAFRAAFRSPSSPHYRVPDDWVSQDEAPCCSDCSPSSCAGLPSAGVRGAYPQPEPTTRGMADRTGVRGPQPSRTSGMRNRGGELRGSARAAPSATVGAHYGTFAPQFLAVLAPEEDCVPNVSTPPPWAQDGSAERPTEEEWAAWGGGLHPDRGRRARNRRRL
jgi:hypothetical protein